ncbi:MAG: DUF4337 domain-containing protein [Alphaproteobacteria bacterium]|nr:DUF4337 domain-containing protein [Alphaproteobacteria bacterium]MBV9370038.1 DUF4337 domain-containing protein [Alphaproteobacteria bacterium]MBV9900712.1 DUF4337 domain-containing protein [Alphaproteobacteria bacterium]
MDSNDAADLIAEIHEERAENEATEKFRNRAALMIAILAAVLAIGGLGGGNATDDMVANNIKASDSWAFYQAKNVRQTMYEIAVDDLGQQLATGGLTAEGRAAAEKRLAEYKKTVDRYDSEPDPKAPNDPLAGDGKKEIKARAQSYEDAFAVASAQDNNFDLAEVALQLALVLGSVAILATNRWILLLSAALGVVGTLLTLNGFFLLV